jgi:hypothetical protein
VQRYAGSVGVLNKIRGAAAKRQENSAMKKLLLFMVVLSLVAFMVTIAAASSAETVNGWVADSQCGAKGANASAAECTKKCLEKGAKMVVVTDSDQKVLTVDNPDALKGHEGHHIAVTGEVKGDSIHVDSAKML